MCVCVRVWWWLAGWLLQSVLRGMSRTFSSVLPFSIVLLLFMFIFTLLGMQLFGGQFAYTYVATPCNATAAAAVEGAALCQAAPKAAAKNATAGAAAAGPTFPIDFPAGCFPPRSNYDSFLWAFVTTFQVMSGENWNAVMYDAIDRAGVVWGVSYFVLCVFFHSLCALLLVGS